MVISEMANNEKVIISEATGGQQKTKNAKISD